jgi:hypothetical protein
MSEPEDQSSGFVYVGPGGCPVGCSGGTGGNGRAGYAMVTTKGYDPSMANTFLASLRRVAGFAKRDGRLYETQMIVGYGMGADRGRGFEVFQAEDLDAHLAYVSRLSAAHDELVVANNDLHDQVAELEQKTSQLEMDHAELAGLDAKCTALSVENAQLRYQIKYGIGSGGDGGDGGAAGQPGKPGK